MDLELKGKVALVTGASSGIGEAVALNLAKEGVLLSICSRGLKNLKSVYKKLIQYSETFYSCVDLNFNAEVVDFVDQVVNKFGKIDILVNCAGGDGVIKPILELSDEDWIYDFSQNFLGMVRFCRAVIPYMQKNKYGRIVNISSIAAIQPGSLYASYSAAKSAVISFTKAASSTLSQSNILINSVLPGFVATNQMVKVEKTLSEIKELTRSEIHESFKNLTTLKRYATPQEVADLITFISSNKSTYITGASYIIDGGN